MKKTKHIIDLDNLSPEERTRVERVLSPRDTVLSLRFTSSNVELWKRAAKSEGESMTSWVEKQLNAAASK